MAVGLYELPSFGMTLRRFDAWWNQEVIDRPVITAWVSGTRPARRIDRSHASLRDRWLDVEFNVINALAGIEASDYALDTLPVYMPNVGPELTGTIFGCELEFGEHTSWSKPIIHDPAEWDRVPSIALDFENIYWKTIERMTDLALDIGAGRMLVGTADLHGNFDILASLREPIELCIDVVESPERLKAACAHATRGFNRCFELLWNRIRAKQPISCSWLPYAHCGGAYIPSCDFWCMVGPDDAHALIRPFIEAEIAPLERSIFHLDGPQALRHLDIVLDFKGLNAVQWQYGSGNGPASRWIDVYRRIQSAGKSVLLHARDVDDALACLDQLDPRGLWIMLDTPFEDVASAEAFGRTTADRKHNSRSSITETRS
jgi:hypothetical protein